MLVVCCTIVLFVSIRYCTYIYGHVGRTGNEETRAREYTTNTLRTREQTDGRTLRRAHTLTRSIDTNYPRQFDRPVAHKQKRNTMVARRASTMMTKKTIVFIFLVPVREKHPRHRYIASTSRAREKSIRCVRAHSTRIVLLHIV